MTQYRKLPRGEENIYPLGIGLGCIQQTPPDEIERIIKKAVDNGINFFDLCGGGSSVYGPFGRAVQGKRDRIYVQMHFGAVYNETGDYGWSRELDEIKKTIDWELETMGFDYMDFGFLHCVDTEEDLKVLEENGILEHICQLKKQGVVRHIGCSSHTPFAANKLLDTGLMDMMLFSINAAYDFEKGDEYGVGSVSERFALFNRCQAEGVGISVMKPYFGGKLLSDKESPFGRALTQAQCLQYCLDRPGVLAVVPGITTMEELDDLLAVRNSTPDERDYSMIGTCDIGSIAGTCVYCDHCQPCPVGIPVALVNKYYDLARVGDQIAAGHYDKLSIKADACVECGHCDSRCPFGVKQSQRMGEIALWFKEQYGY